MSNEMNDPTDNQQASVEPEHTELTKAARVRAPRKKSIPPPPPSDASGEGVAMVSLAPEFVSIDDAEIHAMGDDATAPVALVTSEQLISMHSHVTAPEGLPADAADREAFQREEEERAWAEYNKAHSGQTHSDHDILAATTAPHQIIDAWSVAD